ncbi:AraC family transcriptional regulator [Vallitalea okinawensis]|uniref:AraC family transcriptional regulator n=1 Tax=Vallitalea okinawensis TaxID=2078660 RepID=UPI000CFD81BA|nr:AraC family transcriptional regulator [Vallitalea okinawensis]
MHEIESRDDNIRRGYLNEGFLFFHLKDKHTDEFQLHYHDFNKILVFLSGDVTYLIEGKFYKLKPWDIVFVSNNEVHKPIINPDKSYERIIIWINSDYLHEDKNEASNLLDCFQLAAKDKMNLLRLGTEDNTIIRQLLCALEEATKDSAFGSYTLKKSLFLQTMVYLNRLYIGADINNVKMDIKYDQRIASVLEYINHNLDNDLSIDVLASQAFLNKYYLMHLFKDQTGYTIHHYIVKKRLIQAVNLIKQGHAFGYVCDSSGFRDYSSFVRAFKKEFGMSPKNYYKAFLKKDVE